MGGRSSGSGMGQSLDRMGQQQLNNLSQEQRDSILYYSNGNGGAMNEYLRGEDISYLGRYQSDIKRNANTANNALNNASLPTEVETYRGAGIDSMEALFVQTPEARRNPSALIGRTFSDRGMLSTTTDKGYAQEYAGFGGSSGVLFHIKANKGAKGIYIDPIHSDGGYENELLFGNKAKFKITNAYRDRGGMLHVHMSGG